MKNIISIAKNVLLNEAKAVENLITHLGNDFHSCVEEILKCAGRVVVTGVGKSAIVASKIVATLNSTGTPALFMHAADAIHGDLGMIQKDDIVICISKSGNTSEIKVLIPLIKRTGAKIIGLVGNVNSYLAQHSNFVLNATVETEACPHNLAPTTSTTATMALGDALAVCLLESRNFTSGDFARLHPGGSLGKKLYLKVEDVFPNNQLPLVQTNSSLEEVIMEITSKRLGATAVLDEYRKLAGIITDGDLRRMLFNKENDLRNIKASDIMSKNPKTIDADEYAINAFELMKEKSITQLIVYRNNELVGFVHLHDLLREGIV
jgi:arabinose-5-phosphate isomerase